uniref:Uncharacterized protein n=1 Tax=Candidatus Kentrum sp. LPFa TaxID=2126335 RepID=A0A450X0X9_9GAMM|nr:MAG: hypothetical protein BECKLPF1236B_GA0070989_13342 [Candidatus Kentron sp. LPFa]
MNELDLNPNDFKVNEVWIVIKVNDNPIALNEGMFDLYALMDAASTYVIGQSPAPTSLDSPPLENVNAIFMKGWDSKQKWPKKIIISYKYDLNNSFYLAAIDKRIDVKYVPTSRLKIFIEPLKNHFKNIFRAVFKQPQYTEAYKC